MRKVLPLILLSLLFAFNGINSASAQNADVSGEWDMSIGYSSNTVPITLNETKVYSNGAIEYSSWDTDAYMTASGASGMQVSQTPDGAITGSAHSVDDILHITINETITGQVTGNSVTFTYTNIATIDKSTDGHPDVTTFTSAETCTGQVSNGTITGTMQGTCSYNLEYYFALWPDGYYISYVTGTAPISGTFSGNIQGKTIDTYIYFKPDPVTNSHDATFGWFGISDSGDIVGYYYHLDSLPQVYTTQESTIFNNLADGVHTFYVAAKDSAGNIDSTPDEYSFTIQAAAKPNPPPDNKNGESKDPQSKVGDPINSTTGNMHIITPDLTIPGKGINFSFIRTYNSQENVTGTLGYGWTHSYNLYLDFNDGAADNLVKVKDEQGKGYFFAPNPDGVTSTAQRGEYSTLIRNTSGYIWKKKDGTQYSFNLAGRLNQIKDRNNNTVNLAYNSQGQLTSITDTAARVISLAYDSQGRISRLTDPAGKIFTYNYDSQGNLSSVIDPASHTITYEYDSNHNLTRKIDALGKSTYFTYDSSDRCASSTAENNSGRTELSFDPTNKKSTVTDSKGNATTHYYNDDSLITKIINPQTGQTLSSWDSNLNLTSRTDESGRTTTLEYDAKGNLTKVTDAAGNITTFTYDPSFNLLSSSTDAQGNITTYTRDAKGNLTKLTDSLGNFTSYTYNTAGQPLTVTNSLGKITTFTYDAKGNLSTVKDALANINTFTYDALGNLLQSKDAKGNITKFTYDSLNQLILITYADNSTLAYTYDAAGNKVSSTDAFNNTTYYTYDQLHRLTSTTDALGHVVNHEYDTEGNLILVTDQNNNHTTYEFDSLGRQISQTDALGDKIQRQFDATGNRTVSIDAKGQTTNYTYDNLNRLTHIAYPDSQVSYTYDSLGRRTAMTDSLGTTSYTYDKLGRLTQEDGPATNDTITYTYDKAGNRLTITDPDGKITKYAYDALNRLISITDAQNKITAYTYDAVSNLTGMTYPNGTKAVYLYDNLNRLTKLTQQKTASPNTKLSEFTYTYDKLGRKTKVNLLDGSAINYSYDALGELIGENQASYEYDAAGNRIHMLNSGLEHDYNYNNLNQLTQEGIHGSGASTIKITVTGKVSDSVGIKQITVNSLNAVLEGENFSCSGITLNEGANTITVVALDLAGNTTTKTVQVTYDPSRQIIYTYDNNGNLVNKTQSGDTLSLSYDSANRLTHLNKTGLDEAYQYDGEGRRVAVNSNSTLTNYLYDGMNVVLERNSSGVTSASYLRNPNAPGGIGGVINQTAGSQQNYYNYDALGSVVNLTNTSGAITQNYSYDAFGNSQGLSPEGTDPNKRGFLTKESSSSGLVYFGARYYDPRIGRFISQDPMGMIDGPNMYLYCLNDPVSAFDPYGLNTYYINNKFNTSIPTSNPISHSFVAITERDPITGKEIVVKTFSWVNTNSGMWEDTYKEQNIKGAQAAIDSGVGAWKKGDSSLDPYVESMFENRRDEQGGFYTDRGVCKVQANRLINDAVKKNELEKP